MNDGTTGDQDTPLPLPRPGQGQGVLSPPAAPAAGETTFAGILGEVVLLLGQSPQHRHMYLADLEWRVLPAMMAGQFRSFRNARQMVGLALWASVSEEVDTLLMSGVTRLRPADWKSGERLWLVELIAPFGGAVEMVEDLRGSVFKGKSFRTYGVGENGQVVVQEIGE